MSAKDNGGPAFPCDPREAYDAFKPETTAEAAQLSCGMTLRDYFAAKAMQGLLSACGDFERFSCAAEDAYTIADAMLAERAK